RPAGAHGPPARGRGVHGARGSEERAGPVRGVPGALSSGVELGRGAAARREAEEGAAVGMLRAGSGVSSGRSMLAPIGGVAALAGVLAVAIIAFATLGLALLLPGTRRRVRVIRGGPRREPRGAAGGPEGEAGATPREPKPRSYAEIVELWPL